MLESSFVRSEDTRRRKSSERLAIGTSLENCCLRKIKEGTQAGGNSAQSDSHQDRSFSSRSEQESRRSSSPMLRVHSPGIHSSLRVRGEGSGQVGKPSVAEGCQLAGQGTVREIGTSSGGRLSIISQPPSSTPGERNRAGIRGDAVSLQRGLRCESPKSGPIPPLFSSRLSPTPVSKSARNLN